VVQLFTGIEQAVMLGTSQCKYYKGREPDL
jgi:hypothetical protein